MTQRSRFVVGSSGLSAGEPTKNEAEARLLWAGIAPVPDVDGVRRALASGPDLATVARAAAIHRVGPLLLRGLAAADVDTGEQVWASLVKEAGLRRAQAAIATPKALRAAIEPLRDAGIMPTVLKGAALVERYPAPGLRPMDDVDLLIPADDLGRASAALLAAGWRRGRHLEPTGYDEPFVHPAAPDLPLELHWNTERWWEMTSALDIRALSDHRRRATVLGVEAATLRPAMELCYLAVHAMKPWHVYNRILWAVDLAVVADGIDWAEVELLADRYRCRNALAVGLTLAERLGTSVPPRLLALSPLRRRALDPLVDASWPFDPQLESRHRMAVLTVDTVPRRIRLAVGLSVKGTGAEPVGRRLGAIAVTAGRAARRWWRLRTAR